MIELDPDLDIGAAELDGDRLHVEFTDGHRSTFSTDWLLGHCSETHSRLHRPRMVSLFDGATTLPRMALPEPGSAEHCDLLEAVAKWGAALVEDVPTGIDGTERLARLIGRIRETDFGRVFDIVVEPEVWELSQSGEALDPHTDDPYRYTPSGTSILHCVESSADGGDSLIVDGFAVAESVRADDPFAFELLASQPVPFVRHRTETVDQGEDVYLLAHAPVISIDRDGELAGIRFHERSMAPLDLDPAVMGDYYRAFILFARRVNDPARAVRVRLRPGQAIVYDNQRVLHGRTGFSESGGRRHLRLCTIDREQFHSRLRRLREDQGRPGVDERLPEGSLS